MRYHLKSEQIVDAIQWTGDNLRAVQDFMAPASPLDHGKDRSELGINVYSNKTSYSDTELVFLKKGGWIIRDGIGRFAILQETKDFDRIYEPAPPLTVEVTPAIREELGI